FILMGEVYWDMEYVMQQQGFDFTYDKRLYDRLRAAEAIPVRDHLKAGLDYQEKLTRFLENHDEPRAASVFPWDQHQAAAILTFLTPGLKFFHQGECQGRKVKVSPHLGRAPEEQPDVLTEAFYVQLLTLLKRPLFHTGDWQLLEPVSAWNGNSTSRNFIAFSWCDEDSRLLLVVNYAPNQGQCRLFLPFEGIADHNWQLHDPVKDELYQREGADLDANGLYVDLEGWGFHIFELGMT
ncbi:MAG: alpha-amylase family glycosyl hydrolase, partial [Bacteroidota bacterium]